MTDSLTFLNEHLLWPVILSTILLLGVLLWKEFKRPLRKRIRLRIIAVLITLISLALIAFKTSNL